MVIKTIVQSLIFILFTGFVSAQTTLAVKYFGLTVHPTGDPTAPLQPHKLDDKARFVANFGGFVGVERFVYKDLVSVKIIQGLFTDCSGGWCSVTHIGGRMILLKKPKHRVYLGLRPAFMLRDSWTRFGSAYKPSGFFYEDTIRGLGAVQHRFLPVSFGLEYDYVITPKEQLSVSFTPGVPLACILSVVWKHWFSVKEYSYKRALGTDL